MPSSPAALAVVAVLALAVSASADPAPFALTGRLDGSGPRAARLLLTPGRSDVTGTAVAEAPIENGTFTLVLPTGAAVEPFLRPFRVGGTDCSTQAVLSDPRLRALDASRLAAVENGTVTGILTAFDTLARNGPSTAVVLVYADRAATVKGTDTCPTGTTTFNLTLEEGWNVTTFTAAPNRQGSWANRAGPEATWIFSRGVAPLPPRR